MVPHTEDPHSGNQRRLTESGSIGPFDVTAGKKSVPRTRTVFTFAHPPPTTSSKRRLKLRPRLLLQLHLLSEQRRSFPILDVLASTIFASRLASRFPKLFKGKDGLGPNDLIVLSSGSYENGEDAGSNAEDEHWEDRDVVATICQIRKQDGGDMGKAEIRTNIGTNWEATPLSNGSYEFTTTNADGAPMKVRWVLRNRQRPRSIGMSDSASQQSEENGKRFTFSIINPETRRHPVIASMTKTGMEIMDQYSSEVLPQSPATSIPTSPLRTDSAYFDTMDHELPGQKLVDTDEHLQTLIVLTGLWVLFREGWSRTFSYDDAMSQYSPHFPSTQTRLPSRTNTMPALGSHSPLASPTIPRSESSKSRTRGQLLKRSPDIIKAPDTGPTDGLTMKKVNRRTLSSRQKGEVAEQDEKNVPESNQDRKRPSLRRKKSKPVVQESKETMESTSQNLSHDPTTQQLDAQGLALSKERTGRSRCLKEKTVSTATTLVGLGESDDGGGVHDDSTKEEIPTRPHDVEETSQTRTRGPRGPLLRKKAVQDKAAPSGNQPKKWRGLGRIANAIHCR